MEVVKAARIWNLTLKAIIKDGERIILNGVNTILALKSIYEDGFESAITCINNEYHMNTEISAWPEGNSFASSVPLQITMLPNLEIVWAPSANIDGEFPRKWGDCQALKMIAKITEEWKNMTEKQKAPYEKVVKQKNKKYTQEMEVYKQNKKEDELLKVLKKEAYFRIELWKNQEAFGDLLHLCKFFTSCLRMQSRIRETCPLGRNQKYKSRSNRYCGRYQQLIKVTHAWTGLPRGVKFDPLDHEIMWHLLAKSGVSGFQPHPFIDELFQLL
ncbi:LRR receptor-like serine/threonine-protein kinase RPK2 [Tanacetum coccineum]